MARSLTLVVLLTIVSLTAFAGPLGPTYPLPNGTPSTVTGSGDPLTGTLTYSYSGFNLAPYSEVWWAPTDASFGVFGNTPESLTGSYAAGEITFTGSSVAIHDYANGNNYNLTPSLVVSTTGLTYDPVQGAWIVTGDFQSHFEWLGNAPGFGSGSLGSLFDALHACPGPCSGNALETSFDAGFFYTSASTPEPATFALLGSGLFGLGLLRRRFTR